MISDDGKGFKIKAENFLSIKKTGKAIFSTKTNSLLKVHPIGAEHDSIVAVNTMRRMVVVSISEIPEMQKGMGVKIQKQTDSKISDIVTIKFTDGLNFKVNLVDLSKKI